MIFKSIVFVGDFCMVQFSILNQKTKATPPYALSTYTFTTMFSV